MFIPEPFFHRVDTGYSKRGDFYWASNKWLPLKPDFTISLYDLVIRPNPEAGTEEIHKDPNKLMWSSGHEVEHASIAELTIAVTNLTKLVSALIKETNGDKSLPIDGQQKLLVTENTSISIIEQMCPICYRVPILVRVGEQPRPCHDCLILQYVQPSPKQNHSIKVYNYFTIAIVFIYMMFLLVAAATLVI